MHVHVAYSVNNSLLVRVIVMYKSNNEKDTKIPWSESLK